MPAMAYARSAETRVTSVKDLTQSVYPPLELDTASPNPITQTGSLRSLRARSGVVSTSAPPPSVMTQHSNRCTGEAIIGEERTSSTVMGLRLNASGFIAAYLRAVTATA